MEMSNERTPRPSEEPNPFRNLKPSTMPKLDPAEVAKALGAKPAGAKVEGAPGPITLFAVRQELFRRLQSTGGRPGLPDADKVGKVPLSAQQWKRLEELAAAISEEGFALSSSRLGGTTGSARLTRSRLSLRKQVYRVPIATCLAVAVTWGNTHCSNGRAGQVWSDPQARHSHRCRSVLCGGATRSGGRAGYGRGYSAIHGRKCRLLLVAGHQRRDGRRGRVRRFVWRNRRVFCTDGGNASASGGRAR